MISSSKIVIFHYLFQSIITHLHNILYLMVFYISLFSKIFLFCKAIYFRILRIDLPIFRKISMYLLFQDFFREVSLFFSRSPHNFSHSPAVSPICLTRYSSVFWFFTVSFIKWLIVSL